MFLQQSIQASQSLPLAQQLPLQALPLCSRPLLAAAANALALGRAYAARACLQHLARQCLELIQHPPLLLVRCQPILVVSSRLGADQHPIVLHAVFEVGDVPGGLQLAAGGEGWLFDSAVLKS